MARMTWTDTKAFLFSEGTTCQVYRKELDRECGKPAIDLDHAIFPGRQKSRLRKVHRDWLDDKCNAQRACADCNRWLRTADTYPSIEHAIRRGIEEYDNKFLHWFFAVPEDVSTKRGSKYHEITRIVERCLK